ncbi:MAG: exodeoxyribonuclease VII large subunit [Sedimentisphaerales bacterium]|nr:exodeoxyribonuclease VII large subunit [Sedimentisphaerales bacterium]MBN2841885.1 exodeoxyribonuclease VII large subunit [Sedimentisphaerales bacterium]
MRQGKFNFNEPDDEKPSFKRNSGFFSKPQSSNLPDTGSQSPEPSASTNNQMPSNNSARPENTEAENIAGKAAKNKKDTILSVTQLNRSIKFALADAFPGKITVSGEISNYKPHGSGHVYFSLKDADSSIIAVMWRSTAAKLKFSPDNGMSVLATGRLEVYEPQGKYQLIVDKLEPAGTGSLELAFRELAEKLRNEGLFNPELKKPLPRYPQTIAIVTSPTGAAIADIGQTLNRRWCFARKLLFPVLVQGPQAAGEIAAALAELNRRKNELGIDVIILARGGGSLEDLWPFNEEIVARAIASSQIPVISGVGHEIDTTIADLVADVRAATPTAAAELAVPVALEEVADLAELARTLTLDVKNLQRQAAEYLGSLARRPFFARALSILEVPRQRLDELQMRIAHSISSRLVRNRQELDRFAAELKKIEPHNQISSMKLQLEQKRNSMEKAITHKLNINLNYFNEKQLKLTRYNPANKLTLALGQLQNLTERLKISQKALLRQQANSLNQYGQLLNNLDHRQVLKRGYSVTRIQGQETIISDPTLAKSGDIITTEFYNGTIDSKVMRIEKND